MAPKPQGPGAWTHAVPQVRDQVMGGVGRGHVGTGAGCSIGALSGGFYRREGVWASERLLVPTRGGVRRSPRSWVTHRCCGDIPGGRIGCPGNLARKDGQGHSKKPRQCRLQVECQGAVVGSLDDALPVTVGA